MLEAAVVERIAVARQSLAPAALEVVVPVEIQHQPLPQEQPEPQIPAAVVAVVVGVLQHQQLAATAAPVL
jgi:hypothetical protein